MSLILRNFLFLDKATMADYLSQLEGSVAGGVIDQTTTERRHKGGKAGYKIIEGHAGSETSTETRQQAVVTDASQFQRLYDLLVDENAIQVLDAFDAEIWSQLRRGEVLEVQAAIRLPKPFLLTQAAENISPLIDILAAFDKDPIADADTRLAFEGMRAVGKLTEEQPVPLVFEAASTPDFSFVAHLPRQYLRCDLTDLQGEAVVFGTIQRILQKGQDLEVFNLMPALTSLPTLTRQQRRKMEREMAAKEIAEVVKGPAIVLTPVAVYR